jgi:hypothetical protein
VSKGRKTPRKSNTALHKEVERRRRDEARRTPRGVHAVVTPNWDGSAQVLVSTGKANEITAQAADPHEPGKHYWVVMLSYRVGDLLDDYDPTVPGGGLGVLGPDRVVVATPPICSECATVYTPEEKNTVCTGDIPEDPP